ncbi:hypothetical protein [Protofrankia coriariae]|uniref:Hydroxyneurosporene synthase (CrtC) n=1 Tax=Protofrankia coriariae TaxID=1562887 RepID=A0ABR5F007_9ACTN|nr:hypothetical protein [Protofrankia coriariae]KLL10046.1 hypothetical protein FrCorBMG51_20610 [Protofrankia coriariae]
MTTTTTTTTTGYANVVPPAWRPDPSDERLHQPTGDSDWPWKDTWFFSMRDEASNQMLNMHITISANRNPPTRVSVTVADGVHAVTHVRRDEGHNSHDHVGNSLASLDLVHLSGDSDHELLWHGDLPEVSFEITVRGKHFASYWDEMFPAYYAVGKDGQKYSHYEQVVTGTGWIQWKGRDKVPFDGIGWRDRGWGRRKTEKMFNTGFDLLAGVLPDDSVFSLIALRSHEVAQEAPMPIAGWRSDATTLAPATGGLYWKDAMAWPARLRLDFLDGYHLDATLVRLSPSMQMAWHDAEPEPEGSGLAHAVRDHYAVFSDAEGRPFTLFTQHGYIHKVDVFRGGEFKYVLPRAEA